jgi:hypothetical protein
MASNTDICNIALTYLGARRIQSLTDQTKEAREANAIYYFERDNELRAHCWKFAIKRTQLPASPTPPTFGYQLAYQLPNDFLRAVAVGCIAPNGAWRWLFQDSTDNADYQIEGQQIVTNVNVYPVATTPPPAPVPLNFRYLYKVTDPTLFDPCFVEALAWRMATELAETLTGSTQKKQSAQASYNDAISKAVRVNALEQPPEPLSASTWLTARLPG